MGALEQHVLGSAIWGLWLGGDIAQGADPTAYGGAIQTACSGQASAQDLPCSVTHGASQSLLLSHSPPTLQGPGCH